MKSKRKSFVLPEDVVARIARIREQQESISNPEVIRRALDFYERHLQPLVEKELKKRRAKKSKGRRK